MQLSMKVSALFALIRPAGGSPAYELSVCVQQASDLSNTDWWPKDRRPDAFATIEVPDDPAAGFCRTSTVINDNNPVWGRTCCSLYPTTPAAPTVVQVSVVDEEILQRPEPVGACELDLDLDLDLHLGERWCSLTRNCYHDRCQGSVLVSLDSPFHSPPPPPNSPLKRAAPVLHARTGTTEAAPPGQRSVSSRGTLAAPVLHARTGTTEAAPPGQRSVSSRGTLAALAAGARTGHLGRRCFA